VIAGIAPAITGARTPTLPGAYAYEILAAMAQNGIGNWTESCLCIDTQLVHASPLDFTKSAAPGIRTARDRGNCVKRINLRGEGCFWTSMAQS
jgi:hypothetical protein